MYLNYNKSTNVYLVCFLLHALASGFSISSTFVSLDIPQLDTCQWINNHTKQCSYNFTESKASFDCVLKSGGEKEEMYNVSFHLDGVLHRYSIGYVSNNNDMSVRSEFNLSKDKNNITCTANPMGETNAATLVTVIKPPLLSMRTVPDVSLDIPQLDQWRWQDERNSTKLYYHNFTEGRAIFDCVLENRAEHERAYRLTFYVDNKVKKQFGNVRVSRLNARSMRLETMLNKHNKNISCEAKPVPWTKDALYLKNIVSLNYTPEKSYPQKISQDGKRGWLAWTVIVCVLLLLCIAGSCAVYWRKKKPSLIEPTYANLVNEDTYEGVPLPYPRPSDKGNGEKPEGHIYSEIQITKDTTQVQFDTECPYTEPYNSITYANLASNSTYSQPYIPNNSDSSSPNDGLSSPNDGLSSPNDDVSAPKDAAAPKEANRFDSDAPYAIPIPKALRMTMTKDDLKSTQYIASSNFTYASNSQTPKECSNSSNEPKFEAPYATPIPKAQRNIQGYADSYSELHVPKDPSAPMDSSAPIDVYAPIDSHAPNGAYATPVPKALRG